MKKPRIICVTGSRGYENYRVMDETMKAQGINKDIDKIISGEARGVDRMVKQWAKDNGVLHVTHYADWDKYGKAAGPKRNVIMVGQATEVIAFWDGKSRGTRNCINQAWQMRLPTVLITEITEENYETPTLWRTIG